MHFWVSNSAQANSELKLSRASLIRPGIPLIELGKLRKGEGEALAALLVEVSSTSL